MWTQRIPRTDLLPDDVWDEVKHFIPPEPPKPMGGRPRVADRAVLTGIIYVLRRRVPWELLPREMGCGSGMTCWRRLREWRGSGAWQQIRRVLRQRLPEADRLDWARASRNPAPAVVHFRGNRGQRYGARDRRHAS